MSFSKAKNYTILYLTLVAKRLYNLSISIFEFTAPTLVKYFHNTYTFLLLNLENFKCIENFGTSLVFFLNYFNGNVN